MRQKTACAKALQWANWKKTNAVGKQRMRSLVSKLVGAGARAQPWVDLTQGQRLQDGHFLRMWETLMRSRPQALPSTRTNTFTFHRCCLT